MTPKDFQKYVEAYEEKLKEQDTLNWILGKYIGIAVNNPKKYPNSPLLRREEEKSNIEMTGEEMEAKIKQINKTLGGKVK